MAKSKVLDNSLVYLSKTIDRHLTKGYSKNMIEETLIALGLSKEETEIYLALLSKGALSVSEIAKGTKVKRTYVYKICEDLLAKGLISISNKNKGVTYAPLSPDYLLSIAQKKKQEADVTQQKIESLLNSLKEKYKAVEEKPIVQVFESIEGLKKIYKDILEEKSDILLLRSYYDDKRPDLDSVVMKQVGRQVSAGIHVRTITPLEKTTKSMYKNFDKKNLVDRHIINSTKFELASQILIYNEKVAIISLKKNIISTLIDNKDISDTFKTLFEYLWKKTEIEHNKIVSEWS